eukprot:2697097-Pleurochrysis_carterae.AAC.1
MLACARSYAVLVCVHVCKSARGDARWVEASAHQKRVNGIGGVKERVRVKRMYSGKDRTGYGLLGRVVAYGE